jgi:mRNA-degrading endonuclease RelE of RelBE toxin-antitoxin system
LSLFRIDLSSPDFQSEYKAARKKHKTVSSDVTTLFEQLEKDPKSGDHMPRVGENIYKIRMGVKGQFGKSGGYRIIYHIDDTLERMVVTPIAMYFKPDTPTLPDEEIAERFGKVVKIVAAASLPTELPGQIPN